MLAMLAVLACGSTPGSSGGASPTPARGTLSGLVLSWPCSPVERVGSPCPGRPLAGAAVSIQLAAGGAPIVVLTGADGRYRTSLAPGTYAVTVSGRRLVGPASKTVQISAGAAAVANFTVDSGIR